MNSLDVLYEELAKNEDVPSDVDEETDASSWLATSSEQTDAKKTKSNLKNKLDQTSEPRKLKLQHKWSSSHVDDNRFDL